MKKFLIITLIILLGIASAYAYKMSQNKEDSNKGSDAKLSEVTLALDWTPNTNHTGIYVAKEKGWYREQGIDLKILPYSQAATSDSLVIAKKADVGIGFTEGVVADAGLGTPVVSIASIVAHNTSKVVVRKDSGITSPKDFDGKIFGGYGAPYEKPVLIQMIKNAGGKGEFNSVTIDTDPINALTTKKVDFVWIFDGWEGIQADMRGLELTKFALTDFGIPDYSTPNIISSPETIKQKQDLIQKFMSATAKGYEFAITNPDEAAKVLIDANDPGTFPEENLVYKSQKYLSTQYQDQGKKWGVVERDFWIKYPQFMLDNDAVLDESGKPVKTLDLDSLFTNSFL